MITQPLKFRVFFYDGADFKTGEMLTGLEAYTEDYIRFNESSELVGTDECSIIMLSTGKKDVRGNEVFAKDIVTDGHIMTDWIDWCNNCCSFQPFYLLDIERCHACDGNYYFRDISDSMTIVGNIFQNPDLVDV